MERESKSDRIKKWLDRLNRFSQSGQTIVEFCKLEGVSTPTYYHWRRRLSPLVVQPKPRPKPRKRRDKEPQTSFTQLGVVEPQSTAALISLPSGVTIELGTRQDIIATIVEQVLRHSSHEQISDDKAASC